MWGNMFITYACNDAREDGFPLDKYLFTDAHKRGDDVYFVFKLNLDANDLVQVALGTKLLPQEVVFLQLGVYLSELFTTEDMYKNVYFHNGLYIFRVN